MAFYTKIKKIMKKLDVYGVPVGLRYKSNDTYRTVLGGVFSVMSRIAILSFFIYGLIDVYYKKNSIVKKTLYKDMFVDKSKIHLATDIFDIGIQVAFIGFSDESNNIFRYMDFTFFKHRVYYDQNGDYKSENVNMNYTQCTTERFGGDLNVIDSMSLLNYYCPSELDMYVYGSQTGESSQLGIFITECSNITLLERGVDYTCANSTQIQKALDATLAQVVIMSSYFDAFEFDKDPIKKQYRTLIYPLSYTDTAGQDLYIQENQMITYDSQIGTFFGGQVQKYYDIVDGKQYGGAIKAGVLPQMGLFIMISPWEDIVTRTVTSLMDILTETGGFSNVIWLIAKLSILKLQQQFFYQSLIKKIFKVQNPKYLEHLRKSSNKAIIDQKEDNCYDIEKTGVIASGIDSGIVNYYIKSIPQRIKPDINVLKQRLHSLLCFIFRKKLNEEKNIFNNAMSMLDEQFDIIELMKSIRSSKILNKLVLSKTQRQLIPYFKDNLISTKHLDHQKVKHQQPDPKNSFKILHDLHTKSLKVVELEQVIQKMFTQQDKSRLNQKLLKNLVNRDDDYYDNEIFKQDKSSVYEDKLFQDSPRSNGGVKHTAKTSSPIVRFVDINNHQQKANADFHKIKVNEVVVNSNENQNKIVTSQQKKQKHKFENGGFNEQVKEAKKNLQSLFVQDYSVNKDCGEDSMSRIFNNEKKTDHVTIKRKKKNNKNTVQSNFSKIKSKIKTITMSD